MVSLKIFFVLFFVAYVFSDDAERSLDPMYIQSIEVKEPNEWGLEVRYRNLNVTGLDDRELLDHKFDTTAKSVWLKLKAKLHVAGDIDFVLTKTSKTLTGAYSMETEFIEEINYKYEVKDNDKGVPKLIIKDEKLTHVSYGEPKVDVSHDLKEAFEKEPIAETLETDLKGVQSFRHEMLWKISDKVFTNLVDTYKAIALKTPATGFLEEMEKHKF